MKFLARSVSLALGVRYRDDDRVILLPGWMVRAFPRLQDRLGDELPDWTVVR